jgi:hypothetical protein
MKTIITYICLSILTFTSVIGQTIEEKEKELLKNAKVSERTKYDYKYTDGKIAEQGTKASVSKYNKDGLVLETTTYNFKGDISVVEKFEYDKNNNRILYERKSMSGAYKKTSEYDDEDKIILESGYDGTAPFKTVFIYNSENKITQIDYYSGDILDERRMYEYSGNKATVKVLHRGKDLKSTVKLIYNNKGEILKETTFSLEGIELENRVLEYNEAGLISKEEKYREGELSYRYTYTYDSNNELIVVSEDSKSKGKFDKKVYSYDSKGRVAEYKWKRKPDEEYNVKTFKYSANEVCAEEHTYYPKTKYQLLSKYGYKFDN